MSRLTDLLSKIKQAEPKKELPPGLLDTVESLKKKAPLRWSVFFAALLFVAGGFLWLFAPFHAHWLKGGSTDAPASGQVFLQDRLKTSPVAAVEERRVSGPPSVPGAALQGSSAHEAPLSAEVPEQTEKAVTKASLASGPLGSGKESKRPVSRFKTLPQKDLSSGAAPEELAGLLYLASGYEQRGDLLSAIDSYKKALSLGPADCRTMNNIASLYIRIASPERAFVYLEECLGLNGDYLPALVNMGIAKAETGRTREAEVFFLKALTLDGSNREALYNAAVLYEKTLEPEKARGYYVRLKSLGDLRGLKGLDRLGAER